MVLRRKIYNTLLDWKKNSKKTKAVLIEGARRIGKSTVCEEFAKNEYKSYILIDFSKKNKEIEAYFEKYSNDLDSLFMMLSAHFGVKLFNRESIFIFDEIQMYPQARAMIKHLVADGRYDYIETGSLISIKENIKDIVIPSEERRLRMYPMDFEEFAWAMGEEMLIEYIRLCFAKGEPLELSLHNKAMLLFKQYMLVGGMPKAVCLFIENQRDFSLADEEKRDILFLYRNDIMKINARYRSRVLAIFDQIPALLSRHEKRIVFSEIRQGSYASNMKKHFFGLRIQ